MSQTIAAIDLIRRSMLLINAVAAGEMPADGDLNDALLTLNELLDSWDLQKLAVYASPSESWTLTPGRAVYDWGLTAGAGHFTSDRPVFVNGATCLRAGVSTDINIITQDEYESIGLKDAQSPIVTSVMYLNDFPLGRLVCFPVPSEMVIVNFNTSRQLSSPLTLQSNIALPPGYLRALRYNLAVELWPEYANSATDINTIKVVAKESFGKVKVANSDITPSTFGNIPGVDAAQGWDWRT